MPLDHPDVAATVPRISLNPDPKSSLEFKKKIITFSQVTVIGYKFVVVYKVSSKLVHAFCLQTHITAKCSMRGC